MWCSALGRHPTELPDDHSECEPPDPISNSEVKVLSADGSVGSPHVRVGHRQALKYTSPNQISGWGFVVLRSLKTRVIPLLLQPIPAPVPVRVTPKSAALLEID